jgi:hypothetical protein
MAASPLPSSPAVGIPSAKANKRNRHFGVRRLNAAFPNAANEPAIAKAASSRRTPHRRIVFFLSPLSMDYYLGGATTFAT